MKNFRLILLVSFFAIFYSSCKKDNTTDSDTSVVPKISCMNGGAGIVLGGSHFYYYDSKGRLIKEKDSINRYNIYSNYTYTDSAIILNTVHANGDLSTQILYLNSKGLVTYVKENGVQNVLYKYEYNSDNYLIKKQFGLEGKLGSTTITHNIVNGNVVSDTTILYTPFKRKTTCNYTYLSNLNTTGNENFGMSFWGKSNKNLVSYYIAGSDTIKYNYTFDSKGRVTFMSTTLPHPYDGASYLYAN